MIQVEASQRERRKFLELALTNYGKTLARSEEGRHDVIVFRYNSLYYAYDTYTMEKY